MCFCCATESGKTAVSSIVPKFKQLAAFRPVNRGVILHIARRGNLHQQLEADGTLCDALGDFTIVIVGPDRGHGLIGQKVVSVLRHDAVAAKLRLPGGIGERRMR